MSDPRHELADLIDLLDEVEARVDALEDELGTDDGPPVTGLVAGDAPEAHEERAVRTARARLAARHASEMREGLAAVRENARRLAREARAGHAHRHAAGADEHGPAGEDHAVWVAVQRAGAILVGARPDDLPTALTRCREAARAGVPAATWTALVALDADGLPAVEEGDPVLVDMVRAEREAGGGPVRAALRDDPATADATSAPPAPDIGSLLVLRLPSPAHDDGTDGRRPAALVLAAPEPEAFGASARVAGRAVALQAALLLTGARRVRGLYRALESRDLIGQAKGIVMHRDGVDGDVAFHRLVAASQHANLKLHAVAQWLVEETLRATGEPSADQARSVSLGE